MRLFIGIELPIELKMKMAEILRPMQLNAKISKGWEAWPDYHLTLLFIGETSVESVGAIKERMEKIEFTPFELTTKKFSFFNRRIMYLDFLESLDLLDLKKKIDSIFPEYIRPNEKEFVAHVTAKRWQRYEYDDLVCGLEAIEFVPESFKISKLSLFKSERDSENIKYHII